MLEDVGRIAGNDETGRMTAAVADADGTEWCVKKGDVGPGDCLGD